MAQSFFAIKKFVSFLHPFLCRVKKFHAKRQIRELHANLVAWNWKSVYSLVPVLAASPQPEEEEKTLEAVPITEEVSTEDPRPLSPASEVEVQEQTVAPEAEVQAEEELRPASPVESGMTAKRHSF